MSPKVYLAARNIGDVIGLPTTVAIVILVCVPLLLLGSTGCLLYYYFKARAAKRKNGRTASKTSNKTVSTENDQEMALTSVSATFRPYTSDGPQQQSSFVTPADRLDKRIIAGQYTEPQSFDLHQFEFEKANQRSRDMILPSPTTSPTRPRTAPTGTRPQNSFSDYEYNRPNDYNPSPQFNSPFSGGPTPPETTYNPTPRQRPRSRSVGKPPPIRPPRPSHSPASSVRSFSVFPPKHVLPNTATQSPSPSKQGFVSPSLSPSPPLLPPVPHPPRSQPQPKTQPHIRHPSMDRNSLMPIAPILIPSEPVPTSVNILPTVDEKKSAMQIIAGYEGYSSPSGPRRNKAKEGYI